MVRTVIMMSMGEEFADHGNQITLLNKSSPTCIRFQIPRFWPKKINEQRKRYWKDFRRIGGSPSTIPDQFLSFVRSSVWWTVVELSSWPDVYGLIHPLQRGGQSLPPWGQYSEDQPAWTSLLGAVAAILVIHKEKQSLTLLQSKRQMTSSANLIKGSNKWLLFHVSNVSHMLPFEIICNLITHFPI